MGTLSLGHTFAPPFLEPGSDRSELALAARFHEACRGWSNRGLAPALGISYETLRRYRAGETSIPACIAARLCERMKVPTDWLLLGIGQLPQPADDDARRSAAESGAAGKLPD